MEVESLNIGQIITPNTSQAKGAIETIRASAGGQLEPDTLTESPFPITATSTLT